uniref:Uncharacterized protein n=1 Tax=Ditylenchus dipsaci TaxID=166011 RepID=A0A915DET5_9BILA
MQTPPPTGPFAIHSLRQSLPQKGRKKQDKEEKRKKQSSVEEELKKQANAAAVNKQLGRREKKEVATANSSAAGIDCNVWSGREKEETFQGCVFEGNKKPALRKKLAVLVEQEFGCVISLTLLPLSNNNNHVVFFLTANLALAFLSIIIALFSLGLLIYVLATKPYSRMNVEDVVAGPTPQNEAISTRKSNNNQSSSVDQQSMLFLSEPGVNEFVERQAEQVKLEALKKEQESNHPLDDQSTIQMQDDDEVHKSSSRL